MAARELVTGKGTSGKKLAAQQLFTVLLVQTTAAFLVRSLYQALVTPKDGESEDWKERFMKRMDPKAWAYSLSTEHLKSVPVAGELYNKLMAAILDQPSFESSQNPLNRATGKLWSFGESLFDEKKEMTTEKWIDGTIDILQSVGSLIPGLQVVGQAANTAEFVKGISTSNNPDLLSDEDRIRRVKARYSEERKRVNEKFGKTKNAEGEIDEEIQEKKWAALSDNLRSQLLPLSEDQRALALKQIKPAKAIAELAGFEIEEDVASDGD